MSKKKKTPEVIEDKDLDEASGGIGLLLPAIQKVQDAAVKASTTTSTSSHTGGVNFAFGDGSVR